ncbi:hypothetical protein BY458DRAFT_551329 [Sporodiniella umbellata]|nr:hypothetical protein BY458DRAFT_551329 [Sporodiniella umbellata]
MHLFSLAVTVLSFHTALAVFSGPNDPRIEKWNRMKMVLPDGILPEEPVADLHASMRTPFNREQSNPEMGYKHSALPSKLKLMTPLSSDQPGGIARNKMAVAKGFQASIQEKRVTALDDQGKWQYINLPDYHRS